MEAPLSKKQRKRLLKAQRNAERKVEPKTKKRKGKNQRDWTRAKKFKSESESKPVYVLESESDGGLRRVEPYIYSFETYAKQRWYGRSIKNIFEEEYGGFSAGYVDAAIERGLITVNTEKVAPLYVVKNGDFISHNTLRHEPPVSNLAISYMVPADQPDIVVINKPSTIPIHACGPYRHNSVVAIMQNDQTVRLPSLSGPPLAKGKIAATSVSACDIESAATESKSAVANPTCTECRENQNGSHQTPIQTTDYKPFQLHTVHRIDRLTSGLLLFARTPEAARRLTEQITSRQVHKEYLALVKGKFWMPGESTSEESGGMAGVSSSDGGGSGGSSSSGGVSRECQDQRELPKGASWQRGVASAGESTQLDHEGAEQAQWLRLDMGIRTISHKHGNRECAEYVPPTPAVGKAEVGAGGKVKQGKKDRKGEGGEEIQACCSLFRRLWYDKDYKYGHDGDEDGEQGVSLVHCWPLTGRTHQLRVHLQHLGHPIVNDPLYNHDFVALGQRQQVVNMPVCTAAAQAAQSVQAIAVAAPPVASTNGMAKSGSSQSCWALARGVYAPTVLFLRDIHKGVLSDEKDGVTASTSASASTSIISTNACASLGADSTSTSNSGPAQHNVWYSTSTTSAMSASASALQLQQQEGQAGVQQQEGQAGVQVQLQQDKLQAAHHVCSMYPPVFNDTQLSCPGLCLHSLAYQGEGWNFQVGVPRWASRQ
jgi:23S rRNA-/tRNA-specific pseudouridylate synthase